MMFFVFKQKTAYDMRISDWSSDVCSSDLHKPSFTPHVDCGDNVIVINAEKVAFTGKKLQDKRYYKHTGYAGGIKETSPAKILEGRFPERVLEKAIERMIPRGPLGGQQMRNLRIFAGTDPPHDGQSRSEEQTSEPQSLMRISYDVV